MTEMNETKQERRPRHGTIGWISDLTFHESWKTVKAILSSYLPDATFGTSQIIHPGEGLLVTRRDVSIEDAPIIYHSYSPPPIWGAPYSILRVRFQKSIPPIYMHHGGEEILVPVNGSINYHFFWAPIGSSPQPTKLNKPLETGEIIRINPQIPHHTWATTKYAEAWMIFRDLSEVPASISIDTVGTLRGSVEVHPRTKKLGDLESATGYALAAWGIAEHVRSYREKAGLSIQELSNLADIDPAQLSRLESGTQNIGLEALLRISRILRLPLLEMIQSASWIYERSSMLLFDSKPEFTKTSLLSRPAGGRHYLHPSSIILSNKWTGDISGEKRFSTGDFASWIVLYGKMVVKIGEEGGERLLTPGTVIHFQGSDKRNITTLEKSSVLQIVYSANCSCDKPNT